MRLYGYYTMGKLTILKLREDYKKRRARVHAEGLPRRVHQTRPLPLPLIRKAMLGDVGNLF